MGKNLLVYHWTAGTYTPNATDLNSYQLLIDGNGNAIAGKNPAPSSIAGLNTPAYNIAFCAMCGATDSGCKNKNYGKYPITQKMLEAAWKAGAKFLIANKLDSSRVFTHSVIGEYVSAGTLTKYTGIAWNGYLKNNIGKWDIDYLMTNPTLNRHDILNLFRNKINWYKAKLISGEIK